MKNVQQLDDKLFHERVNSQYREGHINELKQIQRSSKSKLNLSVQKPLIRRQEYERINRVSQFQLLSLFFKL